MFRWLCTRLPEVTYDSRHHITYTWHLCHIKPISTNENGLFPRLKWTRNAREIKTCQTTEWIKFKNWIRISITCLSQKLWKGSSSGAVHLEEKHMTSYMVHFMYSYHDRWQKNCIIRTAQSRAAHLAQTITPELPTVTYRNIFVCLTPYGHPSGICSYASRYFGPQSG